MSGKFLFADNGAVVHEDASYVQEEFKGLTSTLDTIAPIIAIAPSSDHVEAQRLQKQYLNSNIPKKYSQRE